jgi:hypothetical protein
MDIATLCVRLVCARVSAYLDGRLRSQGLAQLDILVLPLAVLRLLVISGIVTTGFSSNDQRNLKLT